MPRKRTTKKTDRQKAVDRKKVVKEYKDNGGKPTRKRKPATKKVK